MKKLLLAMTALLLFAACEQKAEETKKEHESESNPQIPGIDKYLITESQADTMIQRYHLHLLEEANEGVTDPSDSVSFAQIKESQNLSFMIDADVLRSYLDSNQKMGMLDFYLGMDEENKITLIYIGAEQMLVPNPKGGDSIEAYVEQPYYKTGQPDTPYVMDRAMPCPICEDRISRVNP